jgi:hypothetical protein
MVAATEAKKVAWSLYREDEARQQAAKKAAADAKAAAAEKQAGGSAAGVVAADADAVEGKATVAAAAPVEQDLLLKAFQLNEEALRWLVVKKKASLGQDSAVPSAASDP